MKEYRIPGWKIVYAKRKRPGLPGGAPPMRPPHNLAWEKGEDEWFKHASGGERFVAGEGQRCGLVGKRRGSWGGLAADYRGRKTLQETRGKKELVRERSWTGSGGGEFSMGGKKTRVPSVNTTQGVDLQWGERRS